MRLPSAVAEDLRVPAPPVAAAAVAPSASAGPSPVPLLRRCAAELVGTFLLVLIGLGSVHAAVLTGAQSGLWQVAVVWGVGVAMAIHACGAISGAHINPAITVAFAAFGGFRKRDVLPYVIAQLVGAFLAAAALYALYGSLIAQLELERGIARGGPGSEAFAMCYGEYFPNPAAAGATLAWVSEGTAFLAEALATGVLAFVVFAVSNPANGAGPGSRLAPLIIGLTVAALISVVAPITQACFNPARDFGPRVFAWLVGFGDVAIPGPRGGFFSIYIAAPVAGALAGAALHRLLHPRTLTA